MGHLRLLVADDHDLMRHGVKTRLLSHPGWEVCGEAQTGREAVTKSEKLKPDVVILDIGMPDLNGLEAARRIRKASPKTGILILSLSCSHQLIREMVDVGVREYEVKSDSDRDLISAVEALANHEPLFYSSGRGCDSWTIQVGWPCEKGSHRDSQAPHRLRARNSSTIR